MKYMLLIYGNEELWGSFAPEEMQAVIDETEALLADLAASGELVGAYGLADQAQAKVIKTADGAPAVTDGPYIEAKEYIGSFTIIDVASEERALEIAARDPASKLPHGIELRPIMHEAGAEM